MAIRAELSADLEMGPGNGLLRIAGLTGNTAGPLHFSLRRNQGTAQFLGADGRWQAAETWHEAGDATGGTDEIMVSLGPEVIDPIVEQAATVAYQLTVTIGADSHITSLKVIRPLFGSGAAAPAAGAPPGDEQQREEANCRAREEAERLRLEQEAATRLRAEEEERTRVLSEEERRRLAEEERRRFAEHEARLAENEVPPAAGRSRWPLITAALALLVAGGSAGAWYGCAIPGFGPARCQGAPLASAAPAPPPPASAESCSGLDAAACYQVGQQALQQHKLEPARQLMQQASTLGSRDGSVAVARMYDPDSWSAATSPVAKPDWETAVFWYEKAAAQGDIAAKTTAGKLLCKNATMDLERRQGRTYLEQAATAGSEEAKQLLSSCQ